jgi:hypothetical protein
MNKKINVNIYERQLLSCQKMRELEKLIELTTTPCYLGKFVRLQVTTPQLLKHI